MTKSIYTKRLNLLCALLAEARAEAGFSQRDLAARLNRPHSFIAKIEVGERRVDVLEFLDICEQIGVDPVTILAALQDS